MIELNGIQWSLYQGALLPDAPPHRELTVSADQQKSLLRQSGAYFLRWTSSWDCQTPTEFWHVIKDQPSRLEDYLSNTRRYTKRGLQTFGVQRLEGEAVAERAYQVHLKAFARYGNQTQPEPREQFIQGLAQPKPGRDIWAVYKGADMVGYAINQVREDMCEYGAMKFLPEYLKQACSFALIHHMNAYYLETLHLKYITNGSRSLFHNTKMQEFLAEHFDFRKAFCRLHLAYAPRTLLAVRLLFPIRQWIYRSRLNWVQKVAVLLRHEEIRQTFE